MSPEVLWCNLDPAWPFADLVQCHCLDLLPGEHTWVWDASGVVKVGASPWPDSPRPIAPERLPDTLDDLPTPPALGPPLLVLLRLPAQQPPPASLVELVAECARRLARRRAELVLTVPPETEPAGTARWWPDALMVVRLRDSDALRRLHGERLLIEWLRDPELGAELRGLLRNEVLDLTLTPHRDPVGWDRLAGDWAGCIPGVLQEIELLERGVGAGTGADSEPSQGMKRVFGELDVVIEGPGATPPPITPAAVALLRLRAPLFRPADLSRRLGERRTAFLAQLNDHLEKRYSELAAAHQGLAEHQSRREAELLERLSSLVPAGIGFGSPGQRWLDAQEARLRDLEQEATQRAEHLMGELERDLRPAEPERLGDYLRHRFAEDESFDAAVTAAKQEASRLLPRTPLAAALGISTLVASVPVLAARLPGWWGQGLAAYLGDASLWAGDLLWLVLPGALLVLAALAAGRQRRRGLAAAWAAVEQVADTLWQRHGRVLEATFQYAELVFALRQLGLIRDRLKRLREELRAGRHGLNALKAGLEQQALHYRSRAPVILHEVIAPPIGPLLVPAVESGGGPRQWTDVMIRALPTPTTEPIEVHHHALVRSAPLPSAYLRGYALAELLRPGETGRL